MAQKLEVPKFANESEEARWWFDHREELAEDLVQYGTLGEGGIARALRRRKESQGRDGAMESQDAVKQ